MKIDIFDIDGTLTYVFGDIDNKTEYNTYAFWPLISNNFTKDVNALTKMIEQWEQSMQNEPDPTGSSHQMMQKSIETFREGITANDIKDFAKKITLHFIRHGVIRKEAIAYLEARVKQDILCILSTGSYQDGAYGFVEALAETKLISADTAKALHVSGAIVDWENKKLLHANVRERKIIGIEKLMKQDIDTLRPCIQAVYADDPWINDKGIMEIAPRGGAHVISTVKNHRKKLNDGYRFTTWSALIPYSK